MLILNYINRQTIRRQSLIYLWSLVFFTILTLSLISYFSARSIVNGEIEGKMRYNSESLINRIDLILTKHSRLPAGFARLAEALGTSASKNSYIGILKKYLKLNADTLGMGVWFEPYRYSPGVRYFGPYVYKDKEKLVTTLEYEGPKYNYHNWDWYKIGVKTDQPIVWTNPYYDKTTGITMITTTAPFYDAAGKLWGVISGDIDLSNLQKILSGISIGEKGRVFLLSREGFFIADKNPRNIMTKKITENENKSLAELGKQILKTREGKGRFLDPESGASLVYFARLESTGWILGIVIPESQFLAPLNRLSLYFALIALVLFFITAFFALFVSGKISRPVMVINGNIEKLTQGDFRLTRRDEGRNVSDEATREDHNEFTLLLRNYRKLLDKLRDVIISVVQSTQNLATSAQQMSTSAGSFADSAQGQASSAEEITATIEEITAGMDSIASAAEDQFGTLSDLFEQIKELSGVIEGMEGTLKNALSSIEHISSEAKSGESSLHSMKESMDKILASSRDVTNIVELITGISDQINLLSLNAAIEAARAGDAGRGFAVVADEISKLADETSSSIKNIDSLIKSNDSEIGKGLENIMTSIETLTKIIGGVNSISVIMESVNNFMQKQIATNQAVNQKADLLKIKSEEIRQATREEKVAITEIAHSITNINDLTQTVASGAEEISGTAESLAHISEDLKQKMDFFTV